MTINSLFLNNFRNYVAGEVTFNSGVNVIYGGNALGKTNVLEAVYMLAAGRSFRLAKNQDIIRFGQISGGFSARYQSYGKMNVAEFTLLSDKKKRVRLNGVVLRKISEQIGSFAACLFCPEDLRLIKGSPLERRRFLNLSLCQLNYNYCHILNEYNKALEQRNALLKKPGITTNDKSLAVWEDTLATYGAKLTAYRINYISKLSAIAADVHRDFCGEALAIEYISGIANNTSVEQKANDQTAAPLQENFLSALEATRSRDIALKQTSCGPHRDDIFFAINDKPAKIYASQGQQRSIAISLKLAETGVYRNVTGEQPVLLLDDVLSELDSRRREFILGSVPNMQVIITSTGVEVFKGFSQGAVNMIDVNGIHR